MPFDGADNIFALKIPERQELPDPPEITEEEMVVFEKDPRFFTLESRIMEKLFDVHEKSPMTSEQIEESNAWMIENSGENPKEMRQLVCRYLKGSQDNPEVFTDDGIVETIAQYFRQKRIKNTRGEESLLKKAA